MSVGTPTWGGGWRFVNDEEWCGAKCGGAVNVGGDTDMGWRVDGRGIILRAPTRGAPTIWICE